MITKPKYLYYVLRSSEEKVEDIINNIDNYYYYLRKPKTKYGNYQKKKGQIQYRDLYPSLYGLKKIQERLNSFLQDNIKLPDHVYGSVKKKNNILNALKHKQNKYFFSVDLKNFFPNITHHQVFAMFRKNGFSPDVSHILTKLTTYSGALPQGAPSSPIVANLVFMQTALRLADFAKQYDLTFTTYLDDLMFSSTTDFKDIVPEILRNIKQGGFYINHKKISFKSYRPEVTGIFIDLNGSLILNSKISERAKENHFTMLYVKQVKAISRATRNIT